MSDNLVRYSVTGSIAEIMLDRGPVNALSMPLIDALLAALAKARDDAAVRAVIVGSAHKVFCSGLDLDIVRGKPGIETRKFLERLYFALNDTQYRMGKPTIAAVDGAVRAGGMTIAISCDMIISGDASTFGYPEIDVGLIPSIESLRGPGPYAIVPGPAVTSRGPVASVAIYTRRELRDIRTIAMDTSSRTSVALSTIMLRRRFHADAEPVPMAPDLDAMLARADAALIIGDIALFLDERASGARKVDLGEEWTAINVHGFIGDTPITSAAELADATHTPLTADVGSRITVPGTFDRIDSLLTDGEKAVASHDAATGEQMARMVAELDSSNPRAAALAASAARLRKEIAAREVLRQVAPEAGSDAPATKTPPAGPPLPAAGPAGELTPRVGPPQESAVNRYRELMSVRGQQLSETRADMRRNDAVLSFDNRLLRAFAGETRSSDITRLDKKLVWTQNVAKKTYTECPLAGCPRPQQPQRAARRGCCAVVD